YDILHAQAYNEGAVFARNPDTGEYAVAPGGAGRLVLPSDPESREEAVDPEVLEPVRGYELVPVGPEDIGVEALDDHTVRVRTVRPVPYFPGLVAHQFFRIVPQQAIEAHGDGWLRPG